MRPSPGMMPAVPKSPNSSEVGAAACAACVCHAFDWHDTEMATSTRSCTDDASAALEWPRVQIALSFLFSGAARPCGIVTSLKRCLHPWWSDTRPVAAAAFGSASACAAPTSFAAEVGMELVAGPTTECRTSACCCPPGEYLWLCADWHDTARGVAAGDDQQHAAAAGDPAAAAPPPGPACAAPCGHSHFRTSSDAAGGLSTSGPAAARARAGRPHGQAAHQPAARRRRRACCERGVAAAAHPTDGSTSAAAADADGGARRRADAAHTAAARAAAAHGRAQAEAGACEDHQRRGQPADHDSPAAPQGRSQGVFCFETQQLCMLSSMLPRTRSMPVRALGPADYSIMLLMMGCGTRAAEDQEEGCPGGGGRGRRRVQGSQQDVPRRAAAALGQVGRRDPGPHRQRPQVRPAQALNTSGRAADVGSPSLCHTAPTGHDPCRARKRHSSPQCERIAL